MEREGKVQGRGGEKVEREGKDQGLKRRGVNRWRAEWQGSWRVW